MSLDPGCKRIPWAAGEIETDLVHISSHGVGVSVINSWKWGGWITGQITFVILIATAL